MQPAAKRALRAGIFFAALAAATGASAHAHLQSQQPAADAQVEASPQALTLTFSEGIEEKFSGVTLTGPGDAAVATGQVRRAADNGAQLVVPLKASLPSGHYTVSWRVVSVDGHKTQGQYHFSVK